MNQTLYIPRLLKLMKRQWAENGKNFLIGLLVIGGIQAAIFAFTLMTTSTNSFDKENEFQKVIFFMGLFIGGTILASTSFGELSSKPRCITYLLIPASALEKLISGIFYAVFVFFIAYTAIFYAIDAIIISIAHSMQEEAIREMTKVTGNIAQNNVSMVNLFQGDDNPNFNFVYCFFFALQSAYLLGSIYFEKFNFIKTALALLIISFVFTLFIVKLFFYTVPHLNTNGTQIMVYEKGDIKNVAFPEWIINSLLWFAKYAFAPLFFVVAYFRLKEKEV